MVHVWYFYLEPHRTMIWYFFLAKSLEGQKYGIFIWGFTRQKYGFYTPVEDGIYYGILSSICPNLVGKMQSEP